MPIYTIGIIIFFLYTTMKVRKSCHDQSKKKRMNALKYN